MGPGKKKNDGNHFSISIRKSVVTEVPTVREDQTIRDAFAVLERESKSLDYIDYVYVVDKAGKLVGVFSTKEMFSHPKSTPVRRVMETRVISASHRADAERVAHLALKHGIKAVPIVDNGRLVGVVPPKKIISILNLALRKDLFHFAGIHKSHLEYENSMTVPLLKSIAHRVPWLVIGLAGIMLVASFIGSFEGVLQKYLILAFFMPAIVYLSDALGTQLQTLLIRDMAVMGEELKMRVYIVRQMAIALLISVIVCSLMFLAISVFWANPFMAFVISVSAFVSLLCTSFTAMAVTALIDRLGWDAAMGGGPFATVISDATSIIIYFVIATLLV